MFSLQTQKSDGGAKTILPDWIEKMLPAGTRHDEFASSLGRLHFLRRGDGRQVVLVHGNPTWSFLWRKVMNELPPDQYEALAPDLMNLGLSDDLKTGDFNLESHVRYMSEYFRSQLKPGAILVVQDWGGPIGLLAASRVPELFAGFVILNTGIAAPRFPLRLSWFHRLSNLPVLSDFVFGVLGFPLRSLHTVQADKSSIRGAVAKAYRFPIGLSRRRSALLYARMVPSSENHPSLPFFHDLERFCGTLKNVEVVWGTQDPILGTRVKSVRKVLSQARMTEVPAGHFLQEEAASEIAQAISRIAARI